MHLYKCSFWENQGSNIWEHTILTCNQIYPIFFANKSNIFSYLEILPPCALWSNLGEEVVEKKGLGIGVLDGVDDYGHVLAVYTRFWEENCVGTEREGVFAPRLFL